MLVLKIKFLVLVIFILSSNLFAQVKISELPAATVADTTMKIPVVIGGTTKYITFLQALQYLTGDIYYSAGNIEIDTGKVGTAELGDQSITNIKIKTDAAIEVAKLAKSTPGKIIVTGSDSIPSYVGDYSKIQVYSGTHTGGIKALQVIHDGTNLVDNSPGILLFDVGNDNIDSSQFSSRIPAILAKRQFATIYGNNFQWNQADSVWEKAISGYLSTAVELGLEGISFHLMEDTATIWGLKNMAVQFRHNNIDGGDATVNYPPGGQDWAQFKCPIYIQMDSIHPYTHWQNNSMPGIWIRGSLYDNKLMWLDQISEDAKPGVLDFRKARGTISGGKTSIVAKDSIGAIRFWAKDGILSPNNDYWREAASIVVVNDSTITDGTSMPARINFNVSPTGSIHPVTRMSIRSWGVEILSTFVTRGLRPETDGSCNSGTSSLAWWTDYTYNVTSPTSLTFNVLGKASAAAIDATTGLFHTQGSMKPGSKSGSSVIAIDSVKLDTDTLKIYSGGFYYKAVKGTGAGLEWYVILPLSFAVLYNLKRRKTA